jgi:hypothetical protein
MTGVLHYPTVSTSNHSLDILAFFYRYKQSVNNNTIFEHELAATPDLHCGLILPIRP